MTIFKFVYYFPIDYEALMGVRPEQKAGTKYVLNYWVLFEQPQINRVKDVCRTKVFLNSVSKARSNLCKIGRRS